MHQSFHDYYWVWVVGIAVVAVALFYLSLKTTGLLEKIVNRRLRSEQKRADARNEPKNKNRYKSF